MDNGWSIGMILKNKWVRVFLAADAVIVIIVAIIAIINAGKTATMMINVAPLDAEVLVGGQKYEAGAHQMNPGEYSVKISREGLDAKEFKINVAGDSITNLVTFLSDGGDFDFYTLAGNYPSFYKLSEIAGAGNNVTTDHDTSAEEFITEFQKAYALYYSELPINYTEYENMGNKRLLTTDVTLQRVQDGCMKILCIDALMVLPDGVDGEGLANRLLTEKGLNLEEYEIRYKTY